MITHIRHIGTKYDSTKTLSLKELQLFIESDLRKLLDYHFELSMSFRINGSLNKVTKTYRFNIEIFMNDTLSRVLVHYDIEKILWNYNKQVLLQKGGRLHTHYIRFEYELKYKSNESFKSCIS